MISGCYRQALGQDSTKLNLPARQAGSSIMPGKVNPVIPEVVNQVAFRVMGHDVTVEIAAQPSQDYSSTQSMDQSSAERW
jgi:aspartate ammonia-lyase